MTGDKKSGKLFIRIPGVMLSCWLSWGKKDRQSQLCLY